MDKKTTYYLVKKGTNIIRWLKSDMPLIVTSDKIKEMVQRSNKKEQEEINFTEKNIGRSIPHDLWESITVELYEETFGPLR